MHIVLQSGSNVILKRMNRKYTREIFFETVDRLKAARPDFTFTTDIIVGFPGESERDFEDTVSAMDRIHFAKVHMFPYSPRKRTRAALYPNHVPHEVIQARKQQVLRLSEQHAFELRQAYVGQTRWVLLESDGEGHTDNFLSVKIESEQYKANDLVQVKLTGNGPDALLGEVIA